MERWRERERGIMSEVDSVKKKNEKQRETERMIV